MKYWYLELIISDELNNKIKQWDSNNGNDVELLIQQMLDEYFNK